MGKFDVKISRDTWSYPHHEISMTHNGYQWMTFSELSLDNMKQIKKAISEYLKEQKKIIKESDNGD